MAVFFGTTPDDSVAAPREKEPETHCTERADALFFDGIVDGYGKPAAGCLSDLGGFNGKHARDGRACEVDIEYADRKARQRQ